MSAMNDPTQAAGELATLLLRAEAERDEARREIVDLRAQVSAERESLIGCQRERDAWRKEFETLRDTRRTDREMLDNACLALLSLSGESPKRQCLHAAYMSPERTCDLPCMACAAYRTVMALREGIRLYRRRHELPATNMQRSRAWEAEHGYLVPDEKTEGGGADAVHEREDQPDVTPPPVGKAGGEKLARSTCCMECWDSRTGECDDRGDCECHRREA